MIGKDWRDLYQQLPFEPPREARQRTRDIESKRLKATLIVIGIIVTCVTNLFRI